MRKCGKGAREKLRERIREKKGAENVKDSHDNSVGMTRLMVWWWGGGGGWLDPEERCTKTTNSGFGHTPASGQWEREVRTQKVWGPLEAWCR
jgi:hypothetical protein